MSSGWRATIFALLIVGVCASFPLCDADDFGITTYTTGRHSSSVFDLGRVPRGVRCRKFVSITNPFQAEARIDGYSHLHWLTLAPLATDVFKPGETRRLEVIVNTCLNARQTSDFLELRARSGDAVQLAAAVKCQWYADPDMFV